MRKINKIGFFITIGFLISTFTMVITISSIYPFYNEAIETNEYNNNFKNVIIQPKEGEESLEDVINLLEDSNVNKFTTFPMLHNIERGSTLYINKIIGCGSKFDISEYFKIDGEGFSNKDLNYGSKKAVIGEGLERLIIEDKGVKYIEVFNEPYEVVGIIKNSKMLTYSSIVPIKSLSFISNKYDTFAQLVPQNSVGNLSDIDLDKYNLAVEEIQKISIIEYLLDKPIELQDRLYQIIICMVNIMVFSYFYSKAIRKKVSIMRVLGASNLIVFRDILKDILSKALIGAVGGIGLAQLVISYMQTVDKSGYVIISLPIAIITVLIICLFTILVTFLVMIDVIKLKVMKEVRG